MVRRMLIVLALGLIAALGASAMPSGSSTKISAPLFAWSNQQYLSKAGQASRTSYLVYEDFTTAVKRFLNSALLHSQEGFMTDWLDKEAVQQQTPEVLLVVLGSQVKTSDLQGKTAHEVLTPLQALLDKAASSLSVPYIMHEAGSAVELQHKLQEALAATSKTIVVGCAGSDEHGVGAAVEQLGESGIIITCTKLPAESAGTPEGVAAELQQVQQAHEAVAAHNKRQVTVYALRPDATVIMQRRRLQAANADAGVCGQLCQTQVKWLEGILAAFILAIAAFSGMCCLYMLDTPTRFEKPKEGARTD